VGSRLVSLATAESEATGVREDSSSPSGSMSRES